MLQITAEYMKMTHLTTKVDRSHVTNHCYKLIFTVLTVKKYLAII